MRGRAGARSHGVGGPVKAVTGVATPGVTAEYGLSLSPTSSPSMIPAPEDGEEKLAYPMLVDLHSCRHCCAVRSSSLDETLGLSPPASDRMEIRGLRGMLRSAAEFTYYNLRA